MILRIGRGFIEKVDRLPGQLHELAFEAYVPKLSNVFFAITPIVFNKQCDRGSRVPMGTIQRQFKDICARYRLRDLDRLSRV